MVVSAISSRFFDGDRPWLYKVVAIKSFHVFYTDMFHDQPPWAQQPKMVLRYRNMNKRLNVHFLRGTSGADSSLCLSVNVSAFSGFFSYSLFSSCCHPADIIS